MGLVTKDLAYNAVSSFPYEAVAFASDGFSCLKVR